MDIISVFETALHNYDGQCRPQWLIRYVNHAITGTLSMHPNDGAVWRNVFKFNATEFSHTKTRRDQQT